MQLRPEGRADTWHSTRRVRHLSRARHAWPPCQCVSASNHPGPCSCFIVHTIPCLQGRTLTTAWVGDSRMVLGRQKKKGWRSSWEAVDLSTDHKPTNPEERQRILDHHGRVERWVQWATDIRP